MTIEAVNVDDAWKAYYDDKAAETGKVLGWNPRRIFEAGWYAALANGETRSSGWQANE